MGEIVTFILAEFTSADFCGCYEGDSDEVFGDGVKGLAQAIASRFCAPQQWISVTERLPEAGTEVLLISNYNRDINFGYRVQGMEVFSCYKEKLASRNANGILLGITHWMPLPEPPAAK